MRARVLFALLAAVIGVGYARWDAQASCAARTKCPVALVTVRSCAPLDPATQPGVMRYAAELRKQKRAREASALLASYRGVLVEVHEESAEIVDCRRGLPRARYDEAAFRIGGGGLDPTAADRAGLRTYYLQTADEKTCEARFPTGRKLRMSDAASCCDGDPGAPCLISR